MLFWFKGMLIGFAIAAPVGPIGLLCVQRTLTRGRWAGCCPVLGQPAPMRFTAVSPVSDWLRWRICCWPGKWSCKSSAACFCCIWAGGPGGFRRLASRRAFAPTASDYWGLSVHLGVDAGQPRHRAGVSGHFAGLGLAAEGRDFAAAGWLVLGCSPARCCGGCCWSGVSGCCAGDRPRRRWVASTAFQGRWSPGSGFGRWPRRFGARAGALAAALSAPIVCRCRSRKRR